MKSRLLYSLSPIACLFLLSCKKEADVTIKAKEQLQGKWEARQYIGILPDENWSPNPPPGNGNILKFTGSEWEWSWGRSKNVGTFTVVEKKSRVRGETYDLYVILKRGINGEEDWETSIKLSGNRLEMAQNWETFTIILKKLNDS